MSAEAEDREISEALIALREGSPGAMDRLMPLVYEQLRRIAHRQLASEATGHTLSTTGLVHEAYLKLVGQTRAQWQDRAQFFAIAAGAMRRIAPSSWTACSERPARRWRSNCSYMNGTGVRQSRHSSEPSP